MNNKVALVTGASSGIGKITAIMLKDKGFKVYGVARRIDKLESIAKQGINILPLDVTDENSMVECVDTIINKEGRIDVLVNNAGYGSYGAIEDVPIKEARRQMEVNIFGLARMTQLILPYMRKNNYGKIVNISSMGGRVWTPYGGWYHTTKFALEGFSACLRLEVEPFGIDVIVIEPGGIKTDWGHIAADNLEKTSKNGAYEKNGIAISKAMKKTYSGNLTKPEVIAKCIVKAVTVKKPRTRYLIGYGAKPSVYIQKLFGDRLYDKIAKKMFDI